MSYETDDGGYDLQRNLRLVLRVGIAGLLLTPGASKFVTYEASVEFFDSLGLPAAGVLVLVVGGIELVSASLLLLDRVPRLAALLTLPIMAVAAATAGPTWQNLGVFTGASVLIGLDTPGVRRIV